MHGAPVLCPIHHKELSIEQKKLNICGKLLTTMIGHCPECRTHYVNRILMSGLNSITIDGRRYEFLIELSNAYPINYDKEKIEQLEREQKEQKQLEIKKQQDALKQKKIIAAENLKRELSRNPYMIYRPTFITICKKYPKTCFYDGEPLVFVNRPRRHGYSGKPCWCCLYCSRLYWSESDQNAYKTEQKIHTIAERKPSKNATKSQCKPTPVAQNIPSANCLNLPDCFEPQLSTLILQAKICPKKMSRNIGYISIVSSEKEQSTERGVYWLGRSLPAAILSAVQTKKKTFLYRDNQYKIIDYQTYTETQKYLNIVARFCNPLLPQTVYVFAQKNVQHYSSDNYETVTAMIPCMGSIFPVPLTVYYERTTHLYFMNEATYLVARQKYGLPYIRLRLATSIASSSSKFSELHQYSELYLLGYSVSCSDGLSTEERHTLLKEIVNSGTLTKAEIMNHLEWLIHTRSSQGTMSNAVDKWKEDLSFISNYDIATQRKIWITQFKSKFPVMLQE